ncbi:cation-transporting P-type ATPase [Streptomyces sp. NPDC020096]
MAGSEAGSRLERYGPNEIVEEHSNPLLVFTRHKTC